LGLEQRQLLLTLFCGIPLVAVHHDAHVSGKAHVGGAANLRLVALAARATKKTPAKKDRSCEKFCAVPCCLKGVTTIEKGCPVDRNILQSPIRKSHEGDRDRCDTAPSPPGPKSFHWEKGGWKNRHYRPGLQTRFGQVDLSISRDREGRYYSSFFMPYQRRLLDVGKVAIALNASGVSHRKAAEILGLLLGHRYSHQTLSALPDRVLEAAESYRRRPLPPEMAFV
jgi:hypothetical protein